jgi:predicted  nucleic acid-binding Zn-ribbon protein
MATIQQVIEAANALETASQELTRLQQQRAQAQAQIDALAPSIVATRQQVRQARDGLLALIQEGIDV